MPDKISVLLVDDHSLVRRGFRRMLPINEHADPLVARDFEAAMQRIVPEDWDWQHIEEGEENAPSHPRASLMGPQVLVPLHEGGLALGTWQGIFLCEFDGPRTRSVYVSVLQ